MKLEHAHFIACGFILGMAVCTGIVVSPAGFAIIPLALIPLQNGVARAALTRKDSR